MKETIVALNREEEQEDPKAASQHHKPAWKEPIKTKTLMSYFLIYCGWPLCFYLAFIYFNPILKENFGYSSADIIRHNFFLSIFMVIADIFWAFLSFRIHPIRILKIRWMFALFLMIILPFWIVSLNSPQELFLIQVLILFFNLSGLPAEAVLIYHLPIYRRFTFASFIYALSRASMYVITSFSLVYLGSYFGIFGIWLIILPITLAYLYGVLHFEGLERKIEIYPNLTRRASEAIQLNESFTRKVVSHS